MNLFNNTKPEKSNVFASYSSPVSNLLNTDIIELYHGTIRPFTKIDVSKGEPYKDFGRGFYCGESYQQAKGLAINRLNGLLVMFESGFISRYNSREELIARNPVHVYTYKFNIVEAKRGCRLREFPDVSGEWFDFVQHNRLTEPTDHNYDIVIGPTADDATLRVIERYQARLEMGADPVKEKNKAIKALKVKKLGTQFYFRTQAAISYLRRLKEDISEHTI
jgi:hypothetical protein